MTEMREIHLAHESWFTDERPPFDWSFLFEWQTLLLVAAAVAIAVAWRLAARRVSEPELPWLGPVGRLVPWVPRLLAIHAGVSLIAQAYGRTYLAPGLDLPETPVGSLLAILEGIVGVWLVTGWRIRPAAWLLVATGPLGAIPYGVVPILERVDLLGIALFLALLPPGPDRNGAIASDPREVWPALFSLRVLTGASLIVLAFTEKLIRPELAMALIDRYPVLNLARTVGLEVSDLDFVRMAGAVELLIGLLVISGALPQLAVIAAGIPFNAGLFFFGASELIGHLPLYGTMLAMLVYGSSAIHAPVVSALCLPRDETATHLVEKGLGMDEP